MENEEVKINSNFCFIKKICTVALLYFTRYFVLANWFESFGMQLRLAAEAAGLNVRLKRSLSSHF